MHIAHRYLGQQDGSSEDVGYCNLQELQALIKYIQINKASDSDWFTITSSKDGLHWSGKCW